MKTRVAKPTNTVGFFLLGLMLSFILSGCQTVQPVEPGGEDTQESFGVEIIPGDAIVQDTPEAPGVEPVSPPAIVEVSRSFEPVVITYLDPIIQLQSDGFSPNNDGFRDTLEFFASIPVTEGLQRWELGLYNLARQQVFQVRGTAGTPGLFSWNGLDPRGNPVADGLYYARLSAGINKRVREYRSS